MNYRDDHGAVGWHIGRAIYYAARIHPPWSWTILRLVETFKRLYAC